MTTRLLRTVLLAMLLAGSLAPAAAASAIHIDAHFTQHFGGRNGEPAPCPGGELICGEGFVAGYGRATNAFIVSEEDEFLHQFTLRDGSSLTTRLEFAGDSVPGASNQTPGAPVSFGNPGTLIFDAYLTGATGVFAGAEGSGTATLWIAGNVDQISIQLDLELP